MFWKNGKSRGEEELDRQLGRVVSAAYEEAAAELEKEADDAELRARAVKVKSVKGLAARVRSHFGISTPTTTP